MQLLPILPPSVVKSLSRCLYFSVVNNFRVGIALITNCTSVLSPLRLRHSISGITYVEDSVPYIEWKLLTVDTAHSAAAYLGYAHRKPTIFAALEDDRVREITSNTLEETPRISDDVSRMARAPIRKLGRDERFVSPALRLLELGHRLVHLATVIGAVLRYDYPEDAQAAELQETIRAEGERSALAQYARIGEGHPLMYLVVDRLDRT